MNRANRDSWKNKQNHYRIPKRFKVGLAPTGSDKS